MSSNDKSAKFERVKIFLTDVDGVLTNSIVQLNGKTEFKQFNIQDGMGIRLLKHAGIPVGWISNRRSSATTARAKELKVDYLWQRSESKVTAVDDILKKAKFKWTDACFMSDDINDLAVLHRVGLPIAVANAVAEVKKISQYTTRAKGGDGAVREVCDQILKTQGIWDDLINKLSRNDI